MASANNTPSNRQLSEIEEDLIECSICLQDLQQPKALPCLHTYCLNCLRELVKKDGGSKLICPLCKEETTLPKGGVDGLKNNFLVTKLKERKSIYEKLNRSKIPCTNCERSDAEAVSRCLECRDFLCDKCLQSHKKMRVLRGHPICTLEEVRSGKIDIFSPQPKEETCDKHNGQVLWFFCKTCWIPICRDCTVVEHCRPDHDFTSLEDINKEQKECIQNLAVACHKVALQVDAAIERANRVERDLNESVKTATEKVEKTAAQSLANFKLQLQVKCRNPKADIDQWQRGRSKDIRRKKDNLQHQQARLRTAIEIANQVTLMGSMADVAHVYSELTTTLDQLREIKPVNIQSSLAKVLFTPSEDYKTMATTLGVVTLGLKAGCWVLEKQIDVGNGHGALSAANDIPICPSGEIAIADSKASVNIYDTNSNFQLDFNISKASRPHNIVVAPNGNIFVTDMTENVKVYGIDGKQRYKFRFVSTSTNKPSDTGETCVAGLAITSHGEILVGEINRRYISKFKQNGDHIDSFEVSIQPFYLAAASHTSEDQTHQDQIIVSSSMEHTVQIIDSRGNLCCDLGRPTGVKQANWKPTGVCFTEGIIFVSNNAHGEDVDLRGFFANGGFAVYCYSESGEYLNAVTTQVVHPKGLALMEDEKLMVADEEGIKIFRLT